MQLIINLLSPFFLNLGVSQTDIDNYVNKLSGYIIAIFLLLVAAIVVMIAAHWMVKKENRLMVRTSAGVAWVAITAILANVICFGPMYNNLAPIMNGGAQVTEESKEASKLLISETGDEGIALVKNNGILPLSGKELNVFGWASTNPIFGGTGSGSSDSSKAIGVLQSLTDAGIAYNEDVTKMYQDFRPDRNLGGNVSSVFFTDWSLPEPTVDYYTDDLMNGAKDFADTAMIVISRSGGEGQDIPRDMNAVIHGTYDVRDEVANGNSEFNYYACNYDNNGDYDDFDPGESYLHLSNTEENMIEKVCSEFENVVVVINANNTMELGWVEDYPQIGAVILAPGTGETGMSALGRILTGEVNPSGHTVDTYVYDLNDTPYANNYGLFAYTNVDDLKESILAADVAYQGCMSFVNYVEGIYVGYKFYETAAEEGLINYEEKVQFPFGYGLSYTTFSQSMENFSDNGDVVAFDVNVTNTGDVAGKDVVEVYFTPPYNNGGIEKASVNLVQFDKTEILEPGQSQTISFEIPKEDMAAYDSNAVKTANGGYVLEEGEYNISIRSDSHTVLDSEKFVVDADIDYSVEGRASDLVAATNQFQDYSTGSVTYLSRKDGFANYEEATKAPEKDAYEMDDDTRAQIQSKAAGFYDSTAYDDPSDEMPTTEAKNGMKLADLMGAEYDDERWESLLDQLSVEDMVNMVNLAGFQTIAVESVGKVQTQDSDGTSGLNDWYIQVFGTAYSTELLIAQTWNKDLAYRIGLGYGQEYADAGIYGCYGPAMNTHRTAFSGRNFEYYSEDGVLAGYLALNTINGFSEKGVYPYIKHFVMNDQETNRCSFILTYSDEQPIREIYMKPFEICVKNFAGKSIAVMSSFNFIGDIWCGANPNLLNTVLRDEWGFKGMVLTDWNGSYGYQATDDCVRNGNDAMLGFYSYESNQITNRDSATLVKALRQACKNIMYTVVNSGNYTNATNAGGMDNMTKTFMMIDIAIAAVLIALEGFVVMRWLKKRKNTAE